jgi:lauroyl/myristoyl acyltransferase
VTGFDVPGPHETAFIGRRISLASGTARLAFETGALVVPVWRARDRWRVLTTAAPAVDPADHASWQELHTALAAIHTRWILARPAALEDPCRWGWWGAAI